eukprot:4063154-Pleurochrysis_carterae.AAC.1
MGLKLKGAATTVARRVSVMCRSESLLIATRPVTPKAHDYTVTREAERSKSPLDQVLAMRFGYQSQHTNKSRKDV